MKSWWGGSVCVFVFRGGRCNLIAVAKEWANDIKVKASLLSNVFATCVTLWLSNCQPRAEQTFISRLDRLHIICRSWKSRLLSVTSCKLYNSLPESLARLHLLVSGDSTTPAPPNGEYFSHPPPVSLLAHTL